jgi:hypothetical protein
LKSSIEVIIIIKNNNNKYPKLGEHATLNSLLFPKNMCKFKAVEMRIRNCDPLHLVMFEGPTVMSKI